MTDGQIFGILLKFE